MSSYEDQLATEELSLEVTATNHWFGRVVGAAVWALVPAVAIALVALGTLRGHVASSVLWTILALCAQLAAAVFTMTLTTERFTYRAIFNSVVLFAAHYFTFFTFIAIYFPRSNELVKILADSSGSAMLRREDLAACLDENHVFGVALSVLFAASVTYKSISRNETELLWPKILLARVHRVRTEVGVVLAASFGVAVVIAGLALFPFPLLYPLFANFVLALENIFFDLPLFGVGKVDSICDFGRKGILAHFLSLREIFIVFYVTVFTAFVVWYIRGVVHILMTEATQFEKRSPHNASALLVAALRAPKPNEKFSRIREWFRSLAFNELLLKAQFGKKFRADIFRDESATYLNKIMESLAFELLAVPAHVEDNLTFRFPKPVEKKPRTEEPEKKPEGKRKNMIDRLLEAYLLAFMALKTRVSKAVTSFVFESRLVQWLTEGELYEALFANLQRKLWATEAMSSLVLSSRDEDKIGLVQLNQHLQKTLTIFLDTLQALEKFNASLSRKKGSGELMNLAYNVESAHAFCLIQTLKQATSALVFAYSKRTDLPQILGDRGRLVQSFVNLEQ